MAQSCIYFNSLKDALRCKNLRNEVLYDSCRGWDSYFPSRHLVHDSSLSWARETNFHHRYQHALGFRLGSRLSGSTFAVATADHSSALSLKPCRLNSSALAASKTFLHTRDNPRRRFRRAVRVRQNFQVMQLLLPLCPCPLTRKRFAVPLVNHWLPPPITLRDLLFAKCAKFRITHLVWRPRRPCGAARNWFYRRWCL